MSQGGNGPVPLAHPSWLRDQRVQAVQNIEQARDEQKYEADNHCGDPDLENRLPEDGHKYCGDDDEDERGILALRGRGECHHLGSRWRVFVGHSRLTASLAFISQHRPATRVGYPVCGHATPPGHILDKWRATLGHCLSSRLRKNSGR